MTAKKPRNLARAILHTLATILVGQGAQIVAGIATARAFGPAGKGVINYMGTFVGFAVASADGLRNVIAYQVGNEGLAPKLVWSRARPIAYGVGLVGLLLFLAIFETHRSQPAFLFIALAFPFAAYLQTVNVLYLLRHATERINNQNAWTVGAGSSVVIVVAVLAFRANVEAVLTISFLGYVAAALVAALGVRGLLANTSGDTRESLVREQLAFAGKGGISAIVTLLAVRVDILIIGSTLPKAQLGIYTTAVALAELLYALSRAVTWATTSRIATDARADAIPLTARVVRTLVIGQSLAAVVMAIFGPWAIALFYGNRFAGSAPLLAIILPRVVFYSADGVLSYFISVRQGRPGVQFAFEFATLVVCAVATYAALGRYGLHGAALAATVAFVLAFFCKLAYFVRVSGVGWQAIVVPRIDDIPEAVRARFRRSDSTSTP